MANIHFDITANDKDLQAKLRRSNQTVEQWARNAVHSGETVEQMFRRITQAATGYLSLRFAAQIGKEIIKVRGEFQQLGIAFETMLGSKAKADQLMSEAVTFAAKTPFTLTDVATNIKQLMAMGVQTEKVMGTMKALGDVAAGVSVPIARIAVNYGQVATLGKLQSRELRDFAMAGVPLVDELAKNLGKTKNEIQDMISAGQIGFPEVEKAFQTMSSEGGKFYNLMEKTNASVTGQISNDIDKFQVALNKIGQANEGLIYSGIAGIGKLIEHYQDVLDVLKVLVATYGSYKAVLIAVAATQGTMKLVENIRLISMFRKELGLATAAQQAFNVASKANIYVAAIAGIVGLITALSSFTKKAKTTQDRIDELNSSIEQIGKQQEINGLIERYDELKNKTELTKDEQTELNDTIKQLSTIFPSAISGVDEYGNAVELVREKLEKANEEHLKYLKNTTTRQLADDQNELIKLIEKRAKLEEEVNTGKTKKTRLMGSGLGTQSATYTQIETLNESEKEDRQKDISDIASRIDALKTKIQDGQQALSELGNISAEQVLKPYKDLFKKVDEYSEQQLYDTKAKLTELLGAGFGKEAEVKIKKQIDAIAEQLKLPTIKEQIAQTSKDLKAAQDKLAEMMAPDFKTTKAKIEEQKDIIKDLQKTYDTLTGTSKKVHDKQLKDIIRDQINDLFKKLETANEDDQTAIAEKIIALQNELSLREKIADEAIRTVRNEAAPGLISPVSTPVIGKSTTDKLASASIIDWSAVFSDLDRMSTKALISLRDKLKKYISQIDDDVKPEDFKEIMDAFNAMNDAIEQRNPFDTAIDALKSYQYYTKLAKAQKEYLENKKKEKASTEEIQRAENALAKTQEDRYKAAEKATIAINEIGRKGAEIVSAISDFTDMLGNFGVEIGDQGEKIVDGVGQIMNGLESIDLTKPFSIVTGSIKTLAGIGNTIAGILGGGDSELSQSVLDKYEDLMSVMDEVIEKQKELLDSLAGSDAVDASEAAIKIVNKQVAATRNLGKAYLNSGDKWNSRSHGYELRKDLGQYSDELAKLGIDFDSLGGRMTGLFDLSADQLEMIKEQLPEFWAALDDDTREYLESIIDGAEKIEDITNQLNEQLTGLSFDSAKDSLKDLLLDADTTMSDVADNFEDYMKKAIVGVIVDKMLQKRIQEWYDAFAEAMSDDVLTEDEKNYLNGLSNSIYEDAVAERDAAYEAAGVDLNSSSSTSGTVEQSITEDTANELVGLWNTTALYTRSVRDYTKLGVDHLVSIEANTYNTVLELQNAVSELKAIKSNIKSSGSRI